YGKRPHPDVAGSYNNIAGVHYAQGKYPEALEAYEKALKTFESILGPDHPNTKLVRGNMQQVQIKCSKHSSVEKMQ
ncbi:MAG: tetratricopeptide repeat protein, partial [Bacteroidota bacterium]